MSKFESVNRAIQSKDVKHLRESLGTYFYNIHSLAELPKDLDEIKAAGLDIFEPLDPNIPLIFGTKSDYTGEDFARTVFNLKRNFSNERVQDALALHDAVRGGNAGSRAAKRLQKRSMDNMKIIKQDGKSKQGLIELFGNRLYNSQPALEYFKDTDYSPELLEAVKSGVSNPLSFKKNNVDLGADGTAVFSNAGTTGRLLLENMKAHPFKTAGGALLGGANVAGLFDNDKIIGQAAGLGAGGLAAKYLLPKLGIGGIANGALAVMGGGALGSLFDKLMAKKAEEEAAMQQYAQY